MEQLLHMIRLPAFFTRLMFAETERRVIELQRDMGFRGLSIVSIS